MDELLEEALRSKHKSFSDKIVDDVEKSFLNMEKAPEAKSRTEERVALIAELKTLRKKLDTLKNARNVKTAKYNNSVAAKRKVVKSRIDEIKFILENIKDEEEGAKIDAGVLLNKDVLDTESSWKNVY